MLNTLRKLNGKIIVVILMAGAVGFYGALWGASNLPETSRQVFGSVLTGDLVRSAVYVVMLIAAGLILRGMSSAESWLRQVARVLFAAAGYAVIGGAVLAVNRTLPWPGLPGVALPAVGLVYAAAAAWIGGVRPGKDFHAGWLLLGIGLGLIVSSGWAITGALGTWSEIVTAALDAASISALSAVYLLILFKGQENLPASHPIGSTLLAGVVFAAFEGALFAVRGWSSQSAGLAIEMALLGLVCGALLALDQPGGGRSRWALWGFLFAAVLLPLAFTDGPDGDRIPNGIPPVNNLAGLACLLISPAVAFMLLRARALRSGTRTYLPVVIGIGCAAVVAGLYVGFGLPGIQADTFFVVMKDQADTRSAESIGDYQQRRAAVYQALIEQADRSQADLRGYLAAQHIPFKPAYLVNGIEIQQAGPGLREALLGRADVARILDTPTIRQLHPDRGSEGQMQLAEEVRPPAEISWGVSMIHAPQVWQQGITGKGIVVGAMGSGVDWMHPDLHAQYVGASGDHNYAWFDAWQGSPEPVDGGALGSHTLGIVVGSGGIGVAPGAKWIACRTLAADLGNTALYLDCMQFLFAPFPLHGDPLKDGDPSRGAHIVDAAWNCPPWEGCDATTLSMGIEQLRHAGQMFITGAGNDGPDCGTIGPPGLADAALTVGTIDQNGRVARFSSRGPISADGSGRVKPDVVAPGVAIISAMPGGRYARLNGSTVASSFATGVVALLWSHDPALVGDIDRTESILTSSAVSVQSDGSCGAPGQGQSSISGYGLIDAARALDASGKK